MEKLNLRGDDKMARKPNKLKIIPLGGLGGEIGKNITILEYKDDIIIIDCGMSFLKMKCWESI